MEHVKALVIKAVMVWAVVWIVLSLIYNVAFMDSTIVGVIIVVVSYLLGDLVILRKVGNVTATIADIGVAALILYFYLNSMNYTENIWMMTLISAVLIGAGEWFFHKWLLKNQVVPDERSMK